MLFDENTLTKIKLFGQGGKTLVELSSELGLMCSDLDLLRKSDKSLDEALTIYDYNFKQFALSKFYSAAISGKNTVLAREMFVQMQNEVSNSDNEIIVKIVE